MNGTRYPACMTIWISVVAAVACGASTLELSPFGRHGRPFVSVGKRSLGSADGFPLWREFCIQCDEVLLVGGYIFFGKDCVDRALWHTDRAVNALVRINCQEVWALTKGIHRADIDTVGIFAADAGLGDNERHDFSPLFKQHAPAEQALRVRMTRCRTCSCRLVGACSVRVMVRYCVASIVVLTLTLSGRCDPAVVLRQP